VCVEHADLTGLDELALDDDEVVRLRMHRVVGQQHHLLAGMSINCSFSGCMGPTGRKRSLENLQPTARNWPLGFLGFAHVGADVAGW
jgi:hypothetical protein